MATSKKTNTQPKENDFIRKLKKLDYEDRILIAHIEFLQSKQKEKEAEINALLAEYARPK